MSKVYLLHLLLALLYEKKEKKKEVCAKILSSEHSHLVMSQRALKLQWIGLAGYQRPQLSVCSGLRHNTRSYAASVFHAFQKNISFNRRLLTGG